MGEEIEVFLLPAFLSITLAFFPWIFPLVNAKGIRSFGGLQQTVFLMSCLHSDSALLSHFSCFSYRLLTVLLQQSSLNEINQQDSEVSLPSQGTVVIVHVRVGIRAFLNHSASSLKGARRGWSSSVFLP